MLTKWKAAIGPDITIPSVSVLVVIPAYNEAEAIVGVLDEWVVALENIHGEDWAILVVDDASTDQTLHLAKHYHHYRVHAVSLFKNSGHWIACAYGYAAAIQAGCPWILQIDSDGQCDPKFYPDLWAKANTFNQAAFGNRVVRLDGIFRKAASWVLKALTNLLTGENVQDANVPYRLMPANLLAAALLHILNGPPIRLGNVALACLLSKSTQYIPITFRPRSGGHAHVPPWKFVSRAWELITQLPSAVSETHTAQRKITLFGWFFRFSYDKAGWWITDHHGYTITNPKGKKARRLTLGGLMVEWANLKT